MTIVRRNITTVYGLKSRLDGIDSELLKRGKFLGHLTTTEASDIFAAAESFVPGSKWVASEAGDVTIATDVTLTLAKGDVVVILGDAVATASDVVVLNSSLREEVAKIGDLSTLTTEEKDTVVAAINEVKTLVDDVNSSSVTEEQVNGWIEEAKIALGSNYTVDDIAARDALEDLDSNDRIYVRDAGDGKWATYKPTSFDPETGVATDWMMLMSQDIISNAMTAGNIKDAYESNDDTNAFTDADKAKSDNITVTRQIDLDKSVQSDELEQDIAATTEGTGKVASVDAVKTFVDDRVSTSSAMPFTEEVVISGDEITLTHKPRGGVAGIMNFSTVRWVDGDNVSWDAPVAATADSKVFEVLADEDMQWDGNTVMVQYLYQPSGE